ncbi:hypothetical protein JW877_02660 [bacterium]|nr:hypothetical protein [bacterium]
MKKRIIMKYVITGIVFISYLFLQAEDFPIIPSLPPTDVFQTQEYNYIGLLNQIKKDKMDISGTIFTFGNNSVIFSTRAAPAIEENLIMESSAEAGNMPLPVINPPAIDIKDENGSSITLEELKAMTPAIIEFYSENYRRGSDGPFRISKIKVNQVIPTDLPDSMYQHKKGLTPFQKSKEALPK